MEWRGHSIRFCDISVSTEMQLCCRLLLRKSDFGRRASLGFLLKIEILYLLLYSIYPRFPHRNYHYLWWKAGHHQEGSWLWESIERRKTSPKYFGIFGLWVQGCIKIGHAMSPKEQVEKGTVRPYSPTGQTQLCWLSNNSRNFFGSNQWEVWL